jgi:hypothetical protein
MLPDFSGPLMTGERREGTFYLLYVYGRLFLGFVII